MAAAITEPGPPIPEHTEVDSLPAKLYAEAAKEILDTPVNGDSPEQYIGQGESDGLRSPVRRGNPRRLNGHTRDAEGSVSQLMVEKFQDKDGEHLTTVKAFQRDGPSQALRRDELVSGRRVGTKWERSQYELESYTKVHR